MTEGTEKSHFIEAPKSTKYKDLYIFLPIIQMQIESFTLLKGKGMLFSKFDTFTLSLRSTLITVTKVCHQE